MKVVNVFELEVEHDVDDPPGFQGGGERLGPQLGASMLGMTLYELPPGNRICPYHYEYGAEEWLIVVSGRPTLRTPDGERELEAGHVVCFREGPEGAHSVGAGGDDTVRVIMLSTKQTPDMAIYPDSDKIGAYAPNDEDSNLFRRRDAVEYFDGEL